MNYTAFSDHMIIDIIEQPKESKTAGGIIITLNDSNTTMFEKALVLDTGAFCSDNVSNGDVVIFNKNAKKILPDNKLYVIKDVDVVAIEVGG